MSKKEQRMAEDQRGAGRSARFEGVIGRDLDSSEAWYPPERSPGADAPNVVVVVLDDTGFAHLGCYGSDIETPAFDRLAAGGLRYNNFHTTALCSPTRAALLTGMNHHTVGMRFVSNVDAGFPNARGAMSTDVATMAEVLRDNGYATFALGKWHLANTEDCGPAGPFDHWPLQRGFDRFYGFLGGATDQFAPELVEDNHVLEPRVEPGYHISEDLVDRSIDLISTHRALAPHRPFFCYLAFGATHSPHQVPPDYVEKYRGRYDDGWDVVRQRWFERQIELGIVPEGTKLAPRNPGVPAWDDLPEDQRRLFARMQEVFAGFLDHTDAQVGRLVDHLDVAGCLDNTVIVVLSDNGASQEGGHQGTVNELRYFNQIREDVSASLDEIDELGGPSVYNNYPRGWAQVGNTPLRFYKQNTYEGGIRDPLIVHWPRGIADAGGIRTQYHHVVDVLPTILECAGLERPATHRGVPQEPLAGVSFAYTFPPAGVAAPTTRQAQYYEMIGHRAIWADGWKAVTMHRPGTPFDEDEWALYHTDVDFSETVDLASEHPGILRSLVDRWWEEAERHGVLPLDDRTSVLFTLRRPGSQARRTFSFPPTLPHLERTAVPDVRNRSHRIGTRIERTRADQGGVLVAVGSSLGGYVLYVQDNRLVYEYNRVGTVCTITSEDELPLGAVDVCFEFERTDDHRGIGRLIVGGALASSAEFETLPFRQSLYGMSVGRDAGPTVSTRYPGPFAFDGALTNLVFELGPSADDTSSAAADFRSALAEQ
jgi:arylsulfatase A-like enzyme